MEKIITKQIALKHRSIRKDLQLKGTPCATVSFEIYPDVVLLFSEPNGAYVAFPNLSEAINFLFTNYVI